MQAQDLTSACTYCRYPDAQCRCLSSLPASGCCKRRPSRTRSRSAAFPAQRPKGPHNKPAQKMQAAPSSSLGCHRHAAPAVRVCPGRRHTRIARGSAHPTFMFPPCSRRRVPANMTSGIRAKLRLMEYGTQCRERLGEEHFLTTASFVCLIHML